MDLTILSLKLHSLIMLCLCVMENCVLSCLKLWNFSMLKMGKLTVNLKYIILINLNKIIFR